MKQISRYQIINVLADGGMALVYRAHDPLFGREVAIKVIKAHFSHVPEFRLRFQQEAKVIASLQHPAIVPVYDFGEENGQPYLVMALMLGGSLAERLHYGPLSLPECTQLVAHLAPALDMAHQTGIVHRDLKPGNILFDLNRNPYLADFGIAKLLAQTTMGLSQTGMVIGTPFYMSPEQARGDKDIDGRSDIYSLGALLFQLLTGQVPYDADTPAGFIYKHIHEPVPSLRAIRPDLPPSCEAIMTRAMAKNRDARYATAGQMATALKAVMDGQPSVSANVAPPTAILLSQHPTRVHPRAAAPDAPLAQPSPVFRWLLPLLGGTVLLAVMLFWLFASENNYFASQTETEATQVVVVITATFEPTEATLDLSPTPSLLPTSEPAIQELAQQPLAPTYTPITPPSHTPITPPTAELAEENLPPTYTPITPPSHTPITPPTPLATLTPITPPSHTPITPPTPLPAFTPTTPPTPLPAFTPTTLNLVESAWQQGKIAFVKKEGDHNRIFVMETTAEQTSRLLPEPNGATRNLGPWWAPDGTSLAFHSYIDGASRVIIMNNLSENNPQRLRANSLAQFTSSPTWAPDGQRVISYGKIEGEAYFFLSDVFSDNEQSLSITIPTARLPAWSPLDHLIAFAAKENEEWDIYTIPVAGGSPINLTANSADEYAPAWSPDGKWIAYQSDFGRELGQNEIWVMDQQGGNAKQISNSPQNSWSRAPTWSPDGQWIAFVSNQAGSIGDSYGELFIVSVESGTTIQLTNSGGQIYDWRPSWGR